MKKADWKKLPVLVFSLALALPASAASLAVARARLTRMNDVECQQLQKTGESGSAEQQTLLAVAYKEGVCKLAKDPVQAALLFRLAASSGNTTAELGLAALYLSGEGVTKNEMQAASWIRKAADAGDGDACAALGELFQNGVGVPKDIKQAVEWYEKGALAGSTESQFRLGEVYRLGLNGPKDFQQAITWLRRAADGGHLTAMAALAYTYVQTDTTEDDRQIPALLKQSAEGGDAFGQYRYAEALAYGMALPKDSAAARTWYEKAAAQGNDAAKQALADTTRYETIRSREPAGAPQAVAPRIDRSVPPQKIHLQKNNLDLEIHDATQTWRAQVVNDSDVLFSNKDLKVAFQLIENVPCKQKTELYSPTVVSGRAYVPPGWYKGSGEQLANGTYVADLCLHFSKGLISTMVLSPEKWDSPRFLSVIPALDATRIAVINRWGEDSSEAPEDLVPFPADDPGARTGSAPAAQPAVLTTAVPRLQVLRMGGADFAFEDEWTWKLATMPDGTEAVIPAESSRGGGISLVLTPSPIRSCVDVMSRLGGSSSHGFGGGWHPQARYREGAGTTLCVEGRRQTFIATISSGKSPGDPVFRHVTPLAESLGRSLKK